jgi:hypothetical protein
MTGKTYLEGTPLMSAIKMLSNMLHFKCSDMSKCGDERVLLLGGKANDRYTLSSPSSPDNE